MEDNKHNGWRNYETWCVNLWLTNDEGSDGWLNESSHECLQDAIDNPEKRYDWQTVLDQATEYLADRLRDFHEELQPKVDGVWADLLNAAMGEVDWREIAKAAIEGYCEDELKEVA